MEALILRQSRQWQIVVCEVPGLEVGKERATAAQKQDAVAVAGAGVGVEEEDVSGADIVGRCVVVGGFVRYEDLVDLFELKGSWYLRVYTIPSGRRRHGRTGTCYLTISAVVMR
jgi:hypothetical protein